MGASSLFQVGLTLGVFLCESMSRALCRGFCTASSAKREKREKQLWFKDANNRGFLFSISPWKVVNSAGIIRPETALLREGDVCSFVMMG